MFTKEDFIYYFNQILAFENKMEQIYRYIHDNIKDTYYKDFFQNMANEEKAHANMVNELIVKFE